MRKNVISAVAAMTLLASGAFAFESLTDGTIVTKKNSTVIEADWFPTAANTVTSAYTGGINAAAALKKSTTVRGDALIYPAFSNMSSVKTEMVVRNTYSDRAVVAKVVLYSADSTRELLDFNIYLSRDDVFRFWIEDNKVMTKDGSIVKSVYRPNEVKVADRGTVKGENIKMNVHGTELEIGTLPADVRMGYSAVYAMAESDPANAVVEKRTYHKAHAQLAADYKAALDDARPNWRNAYDTEKNNFKNGMMTNEGGFSVPAPNAKTNVNVGSVIFNDPINDILTGTVNIGVNVAGKEADMLLPATAFENFTDGALILWTEGEYAAIQDRRIVDGKYVAAGIEADAANMLVKEGYYTFKKGTQNQIIFTQPYKRILVQLDPKTGSGYYENKDGHWNYSGFKFDMAMYDEDENAHVKQDDPLVPIMITSPYNTNAADPVTATLDDEVAVIKNFASKRYGKDVEADLEMNPDFKGYFKDKMGGFGKIVIEKGIPAIVTQYVGSKINDKPQMNWIYAPIAK